jgi:predicted transcriptional regulator
MTTLVTFKIDPKLKAQAQKKAASEGRTYSDILQSATKSYVDGSYVMAGFVPADWEPIKMTKKEIAEIKKARENYRKGNYYTIEEIRNELGIQHRS